MRKRTFRLVMLTLMAIASSMTVIAGVAEAAPMPRQGQPWLGLAMVHTQTCAPGCDDRVFTLSVENVDPYTVSGDRAVWDYAPGTALTLRLEWKSQGGGGMASSARVYFRSPDGAPIGSSEPWEPSISGANDFRITTIHLDDDPMDGVYGQRRDGVYELYAELVGGADNGADTQGAPAVGPNGGSGGYARGLFSSGNMVLYDHWNASDSTTWGATRWAATSNTSSRTVDVQGYAGRLYVNGDSARTTAKTATATDSDVTFTYQFHDRGARSYLRPMVRGSGASGSSQKTKGYRLEFRSDSATVKLQKVVDGTSGPLDEFTYMMDTEPQRVRFQVVGSTVQAKVWPVGTDEPIGWSLEATDGSVTDPGVFQVNLNHSSGSRAVTINDVAIFHTLPGGGGTTYMALEDRGDLVCFPYVGVQPSRVSFEIANGELCYDNQTPPPSCYTHVRHHGKYTTMTLDIGRDTAGRVNNRLFYSFQETAVGIALGAGQWAQYQHRSYKDDNAGLLIAAGSNRHEAGYFYHHSGNITPTVDQSYTAEFQASHDPPGGTVVGKVYCETRP